MALFQPIPFVFKPDFDHTMLACHDMFDMFPLTCLSCDKGAWHFFKPTFIVFKLDFNHRMMTCGDMFDMFSSSSLSCDMAMLHFSAHFGMTQHVRRVTGDMFIMFACQGQSERTRPCLCARQVQGAL